MGVGGDKSVPTPNLTSHQYPQCACLANHSAHPCLDRSDSSLQAGLSNSAT